MKKYVSSFVLAFIIAFTIFIYEPTILYSNNMTDLWFDLKSMLIPMLVLFILLFGFIILFFFLIDKIFKKKNITNLLLVIGFIIYFASYIQGNYLIGKLPKLDGSVIVWSGFSGQNIITLCVWLILIITYIICIKKFTIKKVINISSKVSIIIFIMLLVSMISTLLTTKNIFLEKRTIGVTTENYETMSNNKNLIVLLADAVDSKVFEQVRQDSKYKNIFEDFTYYPDTLSYFAFTRDSIPLILSGIPNHNEDDFNTYYNKAMNKSPLMNKLIKEKYNINIYDYELLWTNGEISKVANVKQSVNSIIISKFLVNELKYVGYKYLPYSLKKLAKIENMDFTYAKRMSGYDFFSWNNKDNYDIITNKKINKIDQNVFKFVHVEGAHVPFDEDEELNYIHNGTYEQKNGASLKLIARYIDWLKDSGVYNNSAIVVLADHGYAYDEVIGRQNPILYIKGIDEHHELQVSDKRVSSLDFNEAFIKLLDGNISMELFQDIEENRERKFIWYAYTKENKMVEYIQKGNAWNLETIEKTGKEYNR